jgi:hypothetical protein
MNAQIASDDGIVLNVMRKFSKEPPEVSSSWALTVEAVTPSAEIKGGCAQVNKLNVPQDDCGPTGSGIAPVVPTEDPECSSSLSLPHPIIIPTVTIKSKNITSQVFRTRLHENIKDFILFLSFT